MRKIVFVIYLLISSIGFGQIKWMTMNEALEEQKKEPKKILVHFFAQWCGLCKRMENQTYQNQEIIKYVNDNFYAVKFDAEGGEKVEFNGRTFTNPTYDPNREIKYGGNGSRNQFADVLGVRSYPTMVFFDEKANLITSFPGYRKPKELEPYLAVIATDEYQKIRTQEDWEKYIKNFNHQVKE